MNAKRGSWSGDLLIVDMEDLKTMPPSEIHMKSLESKEVDILKEEPCFFFHAGRATAVYKAEATSGENLNNTLQEKKKRPEIQIQMSKLDKISEFFWEITKPKHVAPRTKLHVPKDEFPTPLNYIAVQRDENEHGCISRGSHQ